MAGIVPVFLFLEEASIYALLDLAFDLIDLVLWGGGYGRCLTTDPSNSGLSLRSIWTRFMQDRGGYNAPKTSWYFWMSLLRRGSRFMLSSFQQNPPQHGGCSSLFPVSSYAPLLHEVVRPPSPGNPAGHREGRISEATQDREESLDHIDVFEVLLRRSRRVCRLIPSALAHRTCLRSCTFYKETGISLGEGLAQAT